MPFGFDAECWRQMGYGIEWMDAVSLWVASLPGAYGRVTSFGTGPLLFATAGLLAMGLLKTPLRWSGALLIFVAVVWAARLAVPEVLVAEDGRTFAVRGADGKLAFHHTGGDTFAIHEWLTADADGRDVKDRGLGQGIGCDASGCIGKLADGALVAYVLAPDAFEEDCRRAILVVATHDDPPPGCAAQIIGRREWRDHGALALYRGGSNFVVDTARPANFDRPWAPAPPRRARPDGGADPNADATTAAPSRTPPRDATPQQDDIEADQ
jgi:competence protein ComEC